ncbi:hypothetical protein E2C01_091322 [Portunus trituberculatus]|uniref:Uncharacterized protein n=2 Tax=Portunus trituberculatus TaxID=210409 RepID=A0A5B7JUQ2_PORTR|nr:hypothetical protein [Portunus trituberculatus]
MALGQGSRNIGDPCWSHIQCRRSDENSFCASLMCRCKT